MWLINTNQTKWKKTLIQWGTWIMGQITATRNLVATKVVRHAGLLLVHTLNQVFCQIYIYIYIFVWPQLLPNSFSVTGTGFRIRVGPISQPRIKQWLHVAGNEDLYLHCVDHIHPDNTTLVAAIKYYNFSPHLYHYLIQDAFEPYVKVDF